MDYKLCNYNGYYVNNAKEYLNAIRSNYFVIAYDARKRNKMIEDMNTLINYNSSVDLYAYANLLYDSNNKDDIGKCSNILDIIASWNYIPAKYLLGQLHFSGKAVEKDLDKFFSLISEAADNNFMLAKNALALAYFNGYGCKVNEAKGVKLLEECANAKLGVGYFNIGYCYFSGSYGYPENKNKAFEYYKFSADQYYAPGCYNIGLMYLNGTGCSKSTEKGLKELIKAADLGHLKAQKKVADAYYFGDITRKNLEKAYEYYLLAAENGDPYSMYSVGYMIINNEKASVDRITGYTWIRRAAEAGNESAIKLLNNL